MYSNSCCSFEREIIKICQSSHKMYSNNIVNFQESTPILNAHTKKSGNLLKAPRDFRNIRCIVHSVIKLSVCQTLFSCAITFTFGQKPC